ncbi:hypothetical protein [Sphingomonas sp. ABOLE]|uniref:hypothetical protein n=1 Tax=Sphingomonas sp. ABOLE TaxID=1985878 RepID=UPI000F7EBAC4|nr:hypothetical protein [Sphingomonas sp. ABOLE]
MGLFVLLLIGRAMLSLYFNGYMPQPFFYEVHDTYMDWFNTAYWAHDPGMYDNWATIYPPLSFVVLRIVGIGKCYTSGVDSPDLRLCDWVGIAAIHGLFILNIILTALVFKKIDRRTAMPRAIAVSAGMPMLYAVDRGNIILLCYTVFLLAFGPLVRSARIRWFCAGLAVNFKVYLIAAILAQLLRRRWLWVEGALIAVILIYVATFAIIGAGTPGEIIFNITSYATNFVSGNILDVWYSVTYQPLINLFQGMGFPINIFLGSRVADVGLVVFPAVTRLGQLSIALAAVATWLRPEVVPVHRTVFLGTALALISSEAGGYTQIMILLLVMMEPWRGVARPVAIITCYVLALPGDIIVSYVPPMVRESFLAGGARVEVNLGVGLGMFLRPALLVLVSVSLSAATIADVWRDIKAQGWKNRWRYRRDWPLLPGVTRPERPYPEQVTKS